MKNFGLDAQKIFFCDHIVGQNDGAQRAVIERKHGEEEKGISNRGWEMFKLGFIGEVKFEIVGADVPDGPIRFVVG